MAKSNEHEAQRQLEQNAEYQRRRVMTNDERTFESRDRIAKNLHEQNMRDNKKTTYEQALRKASEIAEKVRRKGK